jgi:hypothetical protein
MNQTHVGQFSDLMVTGELTVNGTVTGAHIPAESSLTVNGVVNGAITVDEDGVLMVMGTFVPESTSNAGLILVAGMASVTREDLATLGRFGVSPGSMVLDRFALDPDGQLRELTPGSKTTLDVAENDWCIWIEHEERFIPLDEIKAAGPPEA